MQRFMCAAGLLGAISVGNVCSADDLYVDFGNIVFSGDDFAGRWEWTALPAIGPGEGGRTANADVRPIGNNPYLDMVVEWEAGEGALKIVFRDATANRSRYIKESWNGSYPVVLTHYWGDPSGPSTVTLYKVVSNQQPTLDLGSDVEVADADGSGFETVTIIPTSFGDDGTIVSWEWRQNNELLADTEGQAVATLGIGIHNISCTITDDGGMTKTDTVVITVTEGAFGNVAIAETIEDLQVTRYSCGGAKITFTAINDAWATGPRVGHYEFNAHFGWDFRYISHGVDVTEEAAKKLLAGNIRANLGDYDLNVADAALAEGLLDGVTSGDFGPANAGPGNDGGNIATVLAAGGVGLCPDADGDGIPDDVDPINNGPPPDVNGFTDSDGDGLADFEDKAPYNPDADGDGVPDGQDNDPYSFSVGGSSNYDDGAVAKLAPKYFRKPTLPYLSGPVFDDELTKPEAPEHDQVDRFNDQDIGYVGQQYKTLEWDATGGDLPFGSEFSISSDLDSWSGDTAILGAELEDVLEIARTILSVGVSLFGFTRVVKELGG